MAAELCTRLHVLTAVLKLKCRSSRHKAVRSIVGPVTKSIGGIRPSTGLELIVLFFSISLLYLIRPICPRSHFTLG